MSQSGAFRSGQQDGQQVARDAHEAAGRVDDRRLDGRERPARRGARAAAAPGSASAWPERDFARR